MTERPINFSVPMVKALLAGAKTQTRRIAKTQPDFEAQGCHRAFPEERKPWWDYWSSDRAGVRRFLVPYEIGDRLWVREEYYQRGHWEPQQALTRGGKQKWAFVAADDVVLFDAPASFRKAMNRADPSTVAWHKRLGRFMPRAASRMTLKVTDVRVERLQAISKADVMAEGVRERDGLPLEDCHAGWHEPFAALWNSINGSGAWEANPWVVAVTFNVEKAT